MPDISSTITALQQACVGTPYRVTPTQTGCFVSLDIVNSQWWQLWGRSGLEKAFSISVDFDPSGQARTTDYLQSVSWDGGAPSLSAEYTTASGQVYSKQWGSRAGIRDDGTLGEIYRYSFDSSAIRNLVKNVLTQQGWRIDRGTSSKVGLWVAIGVGALVLATAIAFGLLAAVGAL